MHPNTILQEDLNVSVERSEEETVPVPVVFMKSTPDREESGFLPRSSSLYGTAESVEDEDDDAYGDAIGGI